MLKPSQYRVRSTLFPDYATVRMDKVRLVEEG